MPDHRSIYAEQGARYESLVSREDYERNIPSALAGITAFQGLNVVELGAGTGRLTRLLAPRAKNILAVDASAHMLEIARRKLEASGHRSWWLAIADHRHLPVTGQSADIVISGWSICYTVTWYPATWQTELDKALSEARRILRPGGNIILLETLGTGYETPHPPAELDFYYAFLLQEGFSSQWVRTDYCFESRDEAENLTGFFFGSEMIDKIRDGNPPTLPECTGIWWKKV